MATPLPLTSPSAPAGSSFSMATPLSSALYPTSVSLCGGSASAVALSSDEFQALGLQVVTKLCRQLLESGFPVLHFYTLNLAHVVNSVLKELGLGADSQARRALPWRQSMCAGREKESVRCGTAAITVACMVAALDPAVSRFHLCLFPPPQHHLFPVQAYLLGESSQDVHRTNGVVGQVPGGSVGHTAAAVHTAV